MQGSGHVTRGALALELGFAWVSIILFLVASTAALMLFKRCSGGWVEAVWFSWLLSKKRGEIIDV